MGGRGLMANSIIHLCPDVPEKFNLTGEHGSHGYIPIYSTHSHTIARSCSDIIIIWV